MNRDSFVTQFRAELRRIGLDPEKLQALAVQGDPARWLAQLRPARRLERRVPAMRDKGRLRTGADADLVLFDPARVIDRATYREPALAPAGISFVLVNGLVVVRDGGIQSGVFAGRPVRAAVRR